VRSSVRSAFLAAALGIVAVAIGLSAASAPAQPPPGDLVASLGPTPAQAPEEATPRPTEAPRSVDGMRIRVARLDIDLPLHEGDPARDVPSATSPGATPEDAAFHYPGTAVPGARGNAYIYAHARVGMFLPLWQARLGDRVEIVLPDGGLLAYTVVEIRPRVPSADVSWLAPTDDERLTLQTSTGPTPAYPRFIVVARREPAG
jgi:hypothetical protein